MEPAPKHLRLLRPFVLTALAAAVAGSLVGLVAIGALQGHIGTLSRPWPQLHGQLQVFGFFVPFVCGFAVFLVPRLAAGRPITLGWVARLSLGSLLGATGLSLALLWIEGTAAAWLMRGMGAGVLIGTLAAAAALRGPIAGHAKAAGGRGQVGYLWLLELALWFLAAAGLADALALFSAAGSGGGAIFLDERWAQAAFRLALEGFGLGMALGVSARMFTGFLGIDPARAFPSSRSAYQRAPKDAWLFWAATAAWALSVALGALGFLTAEPRFGQAGDALFAAGVIPLALRLGLAKTPTKVDTTYGPSFPVAVRGAYLLLVLAALIGLGAAIAAGIFDLPVAPGWADARRHLLALGFFMPLISAMAGRLSPGYSGRPLALPALRWIAVGGFLLSAVLRVAEAPAAQWGIAWLWTVSASSGPIAVVAFFALIASLAVTLLGAKQAK